MRIFTMIMFLSVVLNFSDSAWGVPGGKYDKPNCDGNCEEGSEKCISSFDLGTGASTTTVPGSSTKFTYYTCVAQSSTKGDKCDALQEKYKNEINSASDKYDTRLDKLRDKVDAGKEKIQKAGEEALKELQSTQDEIVKMDKQFKDDLGKMKKDQKREAKELANDVKKATMAIEEAKAQIKAAERQLVQTQAAVLATMNRYSADEIRFACTIEFSAAKESWNKSAKSQMTDSSVRAHFLDLTWKNCLKRKMDERNVQEAIVNGKVEAAQDSVTSAKGNLKMAKQNLADLGGEQKDLVKDQAQSNKDLLDNYQQSRTSEVNKYAAKSNQASSKLQSLKESLSTADQQLSMSSFSQFSKGIGPLENTMRDRKCCDGAEDTEFERPCPPPFKMLPKTTTDLLQGVMTPDDTSI